MGNETTGCNKKSGNASAEIMHEMTEKWKRMERKTFEQREKAEEYYEKNLMKPIEQNFVARNKDRITQKVDYLLLSVGTSYEPLVLTISLMQPKHILFLYTELTNKYLSKIVDYCHLDAAAYSKSEVCETDPLDIYREIRSAYLKWGKPQQLYIDFTGGTKAMSAAAAMAGALINVRLLYVGTDNYLPDFRKPEPGSEKLYFISNPLEVFGDMEIEKAYALFKKYNYAGARERLQELKDEIPDPSLRQQLEFVYYLACTYEKWDALDFKNAYRYCHELNHQIARDRKVNARFILLDMADLLQKQEKLLESLQQIPDLLKDKKRMEILSVNEYIVPLMFTMCQNAMVREHQEKYDMATLLLYRLLEMIEQRRLAEYGLFVSLMNYGEVKHHGWEKLSAEQKTELMRERFVVAKTKIFGKCNRTFLPDQVSLLEGFILLYCLDDDIIIPEKGNDGRSIEELCRIRSMVSLRNNSIFAHGLVPVEKQNYDRFRNFVLELFRYFCRLENIDYTAYMQNMTWISPFDSRYYAGLEE